MRQLFAFNMVSLDGYFAGPKGELDWHTVDAEFNAFAAEQTGSADMLLFGRVTYEMMAGFWPRPEAIAADPAVAGLMNRLPKLVFSRTLAKAEWNNTRLVKDHVGEEILKLKQQPGRDLALFGSANLLATLMRLNLVDEHRLMVNPVVLGSGQPLFRRSSDRLKLKLVNYRTFKNGNVLLCYQAAA
jgi:dihydrofolate reductase